MNEGEYPKKKNISFFILYDFQVLSFLPYVYLWCEYKFSPSPCCPISPFVFPCEYSLATIPSYMKYMITSWSSLLLDSFEHPHKAIRYMITSPPKTFFTPLFLEQRFNLMQHQLLRII